MSRVMQPSLQGEGVVTRQRGADRRAIAGLLLLCIPWLLAVGCPLIGLDDPIYVKENPLVQNGLSAGGVLAALTATRGAFWLPVTWISLALDVTLFGRGAWGFHLTNVVLHAANVVLVYLFLRKATGDFWRSVIAAALYGAHPLRVESVAWATERKDVLSAFFGLLALLAYVRFVRSRRWGPYWASAGLLVLSLMAKPMLVTFPFLLLVLDGWPLRRMTRANAVNLIMEKVPFLLVAGVVSYVTYAIQAGNNVLVGSSLGLRLENAVLSYALYLRDMVYFGGLSVWYPRQYAIEPLQVAAAAGLLAVVTAGILLARRRENGRAMLTGWLWFLGTLVPAIGVVQSGEQARADRFTYFPAIGLAVAVAWLAPAGWVGTEASRRVVIGTTAALVAICLVFTTSRLLLWHDPLALYEQGIARTQNNWVLEMTAGDALVARGDAEGAIEHYTRAVAIAPTLHEIQNNLGSMLAAKGRLDLAAEHFARAHQTVPGNATYAANFQRAQALLATQRAPSTRTTTHPFQESP
jgi:hypothetical protein